MSCASDSTEASLDRGISCAVCGLGAGSAGIIDADPVSHVASFRKFLSGDAEGSGLFWGLHPVIKYDDEDSSLFEEILLRGRGANLHSAPYGVFLKKSGVKASEYKRLIYITLEMVRLLPGYLNRRVSINVEEKLLDFHLLAALWVERAEVFIEFTDFPSQSCLEMMADKDFMVLLDDVSPDDWWRIPDIAHLIRGIKIDYFTSLILTGNNSPMLARDMPNTGMATKLLTVPGSKRKELLVELMHLVNSPSLEPSFLVVLECSVANRDISVISPCDLGECVDWGLQGQDAHAEVRKVVLPAVQIFRDDSAAERHVPLQHRISIDRCLQDG